MRVRVIDFEASGPSPANDEHGLVEIAFTDLVSTMVDLTGQPSGWVVEDGRGRLVNPGVPIPPDTSAIHHIVDEDVAGALNWKSALCSLIADSRQNDVGYFAAHSANFEMQWFHPDFWGGEPEIPFVCTYKAALRLWQDAPLHSNQGLRYWRQPVGLDRAKASPAHRALPDSYVTAFLLRDMLNDGGSLADMAAWTLQPALTLRCRIGEWRRADGRGTPWPEVDTSMLYWILGKDFDEDTMFTARHHVRLREAAAREERERQELNVQLRANGLAEIEPTVNPLVPAAAISDLAPDPNQPRLL